MSVWRKLDCSIKDLQLYLTLSGGQCFRWHKNDKEEWTGVFAQKIWILKQSEDSILYKVVLPEKLQPKKIKSIPINDSEPRTSRCRKSVVMHEALSSEAQDVDDRKLLYEYFRLDVPLEVMYREWANHDPNFKEVAVKFYGVRMLKQDPVENIFSFICSSNNHISRISSMVEKLCSLYGPVIGSVDGKLYHEFPEVDALADPSVEPVLRNAGFGYRAKFIQKSAAKIKSLGGQSWLQTLKLKPYEEAKVALMELPGVGGKVADCICLMSLGHLQAIPVDTHVWQISCRYLPHLKNYKTVTEKVYNEIGGYFRDLYGPLAGWAHTVLFCADLKMFQNKKVKSATKRKNCTENLQKKKSRILSSGD